MMTPAKSALLALSLVAAASGRAAGPVRDGGHKVSYWASLAAGQANMRSGPGRNYPTDWLYQRAGLPLRVIETYPGWRKVRDQDGTEGWMIVNLLTDQRTGMIVGSIADLRNAPNPGAGVLWRAQPGVIGRISHCGAGWCRINVLGREGYVEIAHLWGIAPDETLD
ncbi:MAG TPA: SH3 domain-containing protein [Sphingomonas sp.]